MKSHTDQQGKRISPDDLMVRVSEAILTHIMALEASGVSRDKMRIIVGEDGGTVVAGEFLFQTPIEKKLSKAEGVRLFEVFKQLLAEYDEGKLGQRGSQRYVPGTGSITSVR